jgi:hypothetical protein
MKEGKCLPFDSGSNAGLTVSKLRVHVVLSADAGFRSPVCRSGVLPAWATGGPAMAPGQRISVGQGQ